MDLQLLSANIQRLRKERKLSQKAVAETASLSQHGYRQIEKGVTTPQMKSLQSIADALNVSVMELFRPIYVLDDIRFRSNKTLRVRPQVEARVAQWLEDYAFLEEVLNDTRPYKFDSLAKRTSKAKERDPVKVAQQARKAFGLHPDECIRDICGIFDDAGIKMLSIPLQSNEFFGLSVGAKNKGPAIVVNVWKRISVERWIFTAAHELGHLLMHLGDYASDELDEIEAHEREADIFASEFLMPDAVFQREWADAYGLSLVDRVLKVKRVFKVSYKTVLFRLKEMPGYDSTIWCKFNAEYKRETGLSLKDHREPDPVSGEIYFGPAPVAKGEPDPLSAHDFLEDRLNTLVRRAVESGEISLGRAAEILNLSVTEMRQLSNAWVG